MKHPAPMFIIDREPSGFRWFLLAVIVVLMFSVGGCPKQNPINSDPGVRDVVGKNATAENVRLQIELDGARAENIRLEQDLKAEHERKSQHQSVVDAGIEKMSWLSVGALAGGLAVWLFGGLLKSIPFFVVGMVAAAAPRIVDDPIVHYSAVGIALLMMGGGVVYAVVKLGFNKNTNKQAEGKIELANDPATTKNDQTKLLAEAAVLKHVGTKEYDPTEVAPTSEATIEKMAA